MPGLALAIFLYATSSANLWRQGSFIVALQTFKQPFMPGAACNILKFLITSANQLHWNPSSPIDNILKPKLECGCKGVHHAFRNSCCIVSIVKHELLVWWQIACSSTGTTAVEVLFAVIVVGCKAISNSSALIVTCRTAVGMVLTCC